MSAEKSETVLVCGSRGPLTPVQDILVRHVLTELDDDIGVRMVIQGGASGVDAVAARWAKESGIHCAEVKALWDAHGRSAGPRRNQAMLSLRPDSVLAFPGGRGTASMVGLARKAGVEVLEIRWEDQE